MVFIVNRFPRTAENYVSVCVASPDGVILDLGLWKGKSYFSPSSSCEVILDDSNAFLKNLKESPYFDERLFFRGRRADTYCCYFVIENRIFFLDARGPGVFLCCQGSRVSIILREEDPKHTTSDWCPESRYLTVHDFDDSVRDSNGKILKASWCWPCVDSDDFSFDSVKYLYSKIDESLWTLDGESILLKGDTFNVTAYYLGEYEKLYLEPDTDYRIRIFPSENGKIVIEPLSAEDPDN